MTRDEAKKIIMVIATAFPNFRPADLSRTVDVWATLLADRDYAKISTALRAYILTDRSGFAPSIGQLVGMIADRSAGGVPESEAWAMVCRAIKNSAYGAAEEFARLPEPVRRAVGSADQLRQMGLDEGFNAGVAQSHFLRAYRAFIDRDKMDTAMGADVCLALSGDTQKMITEETA